MLAEKMGAFVHYFTLYYSLRPFGASIVIVGVDPETKQHEMYQVGPSGVGFKFFGCAIGKGRQGGKTEIEKQKLFNKPCKEVRASPPTKPKPKAGPSPNALSALYCPVLIQPHPCTMCPCRSAKRLLRFCWCCTTT